jgi:ATP-dependent Lhr-like helicase
LAALVDERRAIEVGIGGERRFIAAEDAARYRDALGCNLPLGLPMAFTEPVPHPLESLVARYARTNIPFESSAVAQRFAISVERASGALAALEAEERLVRGAFRPAELALSGGLEWCDVDVLRQLRRRSLASLRKEVEPVEQDALGRFLPAWHDVQPLQGGTRRGLDALVETLGVLQGSALVASALETDVLPARLTPYRSTDLDELCTSGEVVWVGAGAIGAGDGRIRLFFADQLPLLSAAFERGDPPSGSTHEAIRLQLARGASFWGQLRAAAPSATEAELLAALWDLVWAGEVTNDSLAPLRAVIGSGGVRRGAGAARPRGGRPRPVRLTRLGPPAGAGRWSLVADLVAEPPSTTEAAHAVAMQLIERHGVLTREAVMAENVVGGFSSVYGVLKVLEERGQLRRGYFVTGLGAAQFSLHGAVDRVRSVRDAPDPLRPDTHVPPIVLAATDPAQPYGGTLPWPPNSGRPSRSAGALVVLHHGVPLAWYDRRGHSVVLFPAAVDGRWAETLAALLHAGRIRSLEVRKVDGAALEAGSPAAMALAAAGFTAGYRGFTLRRS